MLDASQRFDVVVTAGDGRGSRPVFGQNKVLLPIHGFPAITYVLSAVERARYTARIFVVGNRAQLEKALALPHNPWQGLRPLVLLEQGETLYDNVWKAFLHTLPDYRPGVDWRSYCDSPAADKAVLFLSGDIPLATPYELEEFLEGCDLTRYDYFLGLTAEPTLRAYAPQAGRPGFQVAYYTLRDQLVRHNNLHLVKPLRLGNRHYIQKMYLLRHQREWRNIVKLAWELLRTQEATPRMVWYFFCLHLARLLHKLGWRRFPLFRPFFLELPVVASLMSQVLRTRFTTVLTHYGGCALDIDSAEHYEALCANFTRWLAHQEALAKELKRPR